MTNDFIQITSLEELRVHARRTVRCRLALAGGLAYSRKSIRWTGRRWSVLNHIDDTRQQLTDAELWTESNIGRGIDAGALWLELR